VCELHLLGFAYRDLIISSTPSGAKLVDLECATEQTGETREAER